ncbi:hypothetical protein BBC27_12835 [Acidithiobacillus ferrivorans]|uniref:Uncharacterized protein n=2 Tax=Acidithiobacillus ferrivorans TaxID=160808 RepID=A0A1B9BXT1_9PROT|nr:hypothetical protein BBC27_12835 [Acidithiobacillus ferrivorans]
MSLRTLIEKGPNPDKGLQALVLQHYQDIATARQLLWGWVDIARELGIEGQENSLLRSFQRVHAKVGQGTLKLVLANQRGKVVNAVEPPVAKRPLPGQIPVGDGPAINAELAAKGINFK